MRRALMGALLLVLVPVAGCETGDSDALPPCPELTPSAVMVPGLAGRIAYSSLNGGGTAAPVSGV